MNIIQSIQPAAYVLLITTTTGCGVGRNYLELEGPRYAGAPAIRARLLRPTR